MDEKSGGDDQIPKVFILVKGTSGKKERRIATVEDLFTEARSSITMVDEGITYSCGVPRKRKHNNNTIQYEKVYKCCMVHNKKTKRESGKMIRSTETNPIVMSLVVRGEWRVTFGKTRIGLK